jgi:hypothetical protein
MDEDEDEDGNIPCLFLARMAIRYQRTNADDFLKFVINEPLAVTSNFSV